MAKSRKIGGKAALDSPETVSQAKKNGSKWTYSDGGSEQWQRRP